MFHTPWIVYAVLCLFFLAPLGYAEARRMIAPDIEFGTVNAASAVGNVGTTRNATHVPIIISGSTNSVSNAVTGRVDVRTFGAVGDGATDDTAAFNLAIAAAGSSKQLYIPVGTFKLTDSLRKVVHVRGENQWLSKIHFQPTVPGKILFDMSVNNIKVYGYNYNPEISNLTILGGGSVNKTALRMWHCTEAKIDSVHVHFDTGAGDSSTDSIALNIMGCDSTIISNCTFRAARTILAENQPTSPRNNLDHVTFENMSLWNLNGGHPLVEFQIVATQVAFKGRQTWVGGSSGFYSVLLDHANLSFENIRWEDGGQTQTQHTFHITGKSTGKRAPTESSNVSIRDSYIGINTGFNGIHIRYMWMVLLENIHGSMSSVPVSHLYDIDGTNVHVTAINANTGIGRIDPLIGKDLKLVFSVGGYAGTGGIAYTRFYTSTKTFIGGVKGKPYVGLMDSLYWTYRGTVAPSAEIFILDEHLSKSELRSAKIEIEAFDITNLTRHGSVVYNYISNGAIDNLYLATIIDNTYPIGSLLKGKNGLYYRNSTGIALEINMRVYYYPVPIRD